MLLQFISTFDDDTNILIKDLEQEPRFFEGAEETMIIGRKVSNNSVRLQTDGDNKVFSDDNAEWKCVVVFVTA